MRQAPPAPAHVDVYHREEETNGEPAFRVLSADQRAVTFDERVHLRSAGNNGDRITISAAQPMSGFRPLQRAATYDPRLRAQKKLLTASDVMYRRYFNAVEDRASLVDDGDEEDGTKRRRSLYRIAEAEEESPATVKEAVVVLDPFSTGMTLAASVMARGYECICVYSDTLAVMRELIKHIPQSFTDQYAAIIFHDGAHEHAEKAYADTVAAIKQVRGVKIIGIIAGAETGVMMADKLSEDFALTTNGSGGSDARRNKYLMGEKVRAAGLRAVKQRSATKWAQIVDFIENELKPSPFRVIVKPNESAGSDDVFLCTSMDEVKRAFGNIQGKINGLGLENTATLVQEFLDGIEYVVDTVSRNGQHKVVAVWEYDKRVMNGAPFVYFGVLLRAAAGDVLTPVVNYVLQVLDALDVVHGPGHAEVKFVNGEPCLVEIGSRCHGGEGTYVPIVNRCIGYNQVECTLDSYFDEQAFNALPERVRTLYHCCLCCYVDVFSNAAIILCKRIASEAEGLWRGGDARVVQTRHRGELPGPAGDRGHGLVRLAELPCARGRRAAGYD